MLGSDAFPVFMTKALFRVHARVLVSREAYSDDWKLGNSGGTGTRVLWFTASAR